jgi:hypothetical protein
MPGTEARDCSCFILEHLQHRIDLRYTQHSPHWSSIGVDQLQRSGELKELKFLESQIGRAGKMASGPLLAQSRRDIWELQQLAEKQS